MKGANKMNDLQIFENSEFGEIRAISIDNEPWFVGKDIAERLGYKETANMRKLISKEDYTEIDPQKLEITGFVQNGSIHRMLLINESGLYAAIFGSTLPKAREFKRWVTSEVLPSIRKHGMYATEELLNDPDLAIKTFQALKDEREKNKRLEAENKAMIPAKVFADSVVASESSILIRDFAKILRQNGVPIGERRLYTWFREHGYICKNSRRPTQYAMERELFEIIVRTIQRAGKTPLEEQTTKITGKGQIYFTNKFLGK
jgi:anti-repressor protein